MYYVYLIVSEEGKKYIGVTSDLKRRISSHNSLTNKGYTRGKKWKIVYYEAYLSKKDAIIREKRLKQDGRAKYALLKRVSNSLFEA